MFFLRIILLAFVFFSSNVLAEPIAGLPDPFVPQVLPRADYGYGGESQKTLRPVAPEVCGSKGLLPPGALGASNGNCSNQCVCDQFGNICQWIRFCR